MLQLKTSRCRRSKSSLRLPRPSQQPRRRKKMKRKLNLFNKRKSRLAILTLSCWLMISILAFYLCCLKTCVMKSSILCKLVMLK